MKDYNIYEIDENGAGFILRDYLRRKLLLSHRSLVNIKKHEGISLNGRKPYMSTVLKEGDKLQIVVQDEPSENIIPEMMVLDIIYEDEYFIIINKPAGMPVHPTRNHFTGTLANGLANYWMQTNMNIKIRPVIRLDKNTSGLILFAKNAHIQHLFSMKMGTNEFDKQYIAVISGRMKDNEGTIDAPISRESASSIKRIVCESGDRAITHYTILERFDNSCLAAITIETGRTHQIRVHMNSIGHPLLGDDLYGGDSGGCQIHRHALHADKMTLRHPVCHTWMSFEAPLPDDMHQLIEDLRAKNGTML